MNNNGKTYAVFRLSVISVVFVSRAFSQSQIVSSSNIFPLSKPIKNNNNNNSKQ